MRRITLHHDITVCSLYTVIHVPPEYKRHITEVVQLLSLLPAPVLLLGDFSGANSL